MTLPEIMMVKGRVVDSKEEWFVSNSLTKYGWEFIYQQPYFGGWMVSGGFVVDFLVITVPLPTPLWVNGEYWHSGVQAERDALHQTLLQSRLRGQYLPAKTLWAEDLSDQDESDKSVLAMFGRQR